jgi:hypothetical protein
MKLFAKFTQKKQRVDPRSEAFTEKVRFLLTSHGITGKRELNECALKLNIKSIKFLKKVNTGGLNDDDIKQFVEDMRPDLSKYGVTDPTEQESIIGDYMDILIGMAGSE